MDLIGSWRKRLDRAALPLGLLGLAAVAIYNWWQWQRDKTQLAQLKEPEPLLALEEWPALPQVSVLVAAWNEADFIERHIQSFLTLRYPRRELVLCAGGEDGTFELAHRYTDQDVIVLEQLSGEGKQSALSRSLPQASGSIIYLTDADCLLDDEAFERTLYPVVSDQEQVCTGGSVPLPEQMDNPFVFTQAASQLYSSYNSPPYANGLLGRNCAVDRELLQLAGGLEAEASTGTDYVLAKILLRTGARIRQLPQSQVTTRFPTSIRGYIRQQRRWLRNVAIHGVRFQEMAEVRLSLTTSLIGLCMLLLPFGGILLGSMFLVVWLLLYSHALFSRMRYYAFSTRVLKRHLEIRHLLWQLPLILFDFVTWSSPLLDYLLPVRRLVW